MQSITSGKIIKISDLNLFWAVAFNFPGPCCLVLATSLLETVYHLRRCHAQNKVRAQSLAISENEIQGVASKNP